ncbi:hypothetical protein K5I29_04310 [Flavobacterium agricola]|uniref:Uncharacterized protein n=1 Tax=Flavobacterium agricola TaxID=2870839 RepID=A0ABY6M2X1_9FLAO|nr:hypothetical protein [Flavobacterium agricola]UYW02130.1 hypothetical protein K5I29_04310 [Flavobacterium agricola]
MKTAITILGAVMLGLVFFVPSTPVDYPTEEIIKQREEIVQKEQRINSMIKIIELQMELESNYLEK